MKRVLLFSLLILTISLSAFADAVVASGKTFTPVGDYKIETADKPFVLDGRELKTFIISYENSPMKVTVAIDKTKKCANYLVMSDKLSVQYVCNSSFFGVEKVDRQYNKQGIITADTDLNREEYFHQRVLCDGNNSSLENTKLIAAFFPSLVKDINDILAKR
jgi:hypothetical protein